MVISGSEPDGGTGCKLAFQVHVTVAGGFAPVTEQFHWLPPWATLTTANPGGNISVTVITPWLHDPVSTFVTAIVAVKGCPLTNGLGWIFFSIFRSHLGGGVLQGGQPAPLL